MLVIDPTKAAVMQDYDARHCYVCDCRYLSFGIRETVWACGLHPCGMPKSCPPECAAAFAVPAWPRASCSEPGTRALSRFRPDARGGEIGSAARSAPGR